MEPYKALSRSIAGKTVIITGAASGMGRATAHLFARESANVVVSDLHQDKVDIVVQEIKDAGIETVIGWALDVGDKAAIQNTVQKTVDQFGGLDIVINNAGFAHGVMIEGDDDDYETSWERSIRVMLTSHQWMVRAALPHLEKSGEGRIINVASTEGHGATPGNSPYVAAKHGVIGLTRGMAVELAPKGITANAICPGPIHTGITSGIQDDHKTIYAKRRVPARRYGIPEEVANITLSCVLPAASYLTGQAICVDGGMTIKNA